MIAHVRRRSLLAVAALACCCLAAADEPAADSVKLPVVDVADKAALEANIEKDILLSGTCKSATWSDTGKVLNIDFKGAEETKVDAVAFSSTKKRLDAAFNGDVAKTITGAPLRIRGRLREYSGKTGAKGHAEITISDPSQITIVIP